MHKPLLFFSLTILATLLLVPALVQAQSCNVPNAPGETNYACVPSANLAACQAACTRLLIPVDQCIFFSNNINCQAPASNNQTDPTQPKGCVPGVNCVQLKNPLGEGVERTDLRAIIGEVIQKILTVLGSITLLVFIAGGVMWLTSGGSEEKVAKGSKTMLYAAIGIAVIFAAYAILNTVIKTLTGTG